MATILFTDADGTWKLHNGKPWPASRFSGWHPDSLPFGDSAPRLSDGAITMFRLRDDFGVTFELSKISSKRGWNSWLHAEDFSNAAWSKSGLSVDSDLNTAPDGSSTADRLVEDGTTGAHFIAQELTGASDNTIHTIAVCALSVSRAWVALMIELKSGSTAAAWFNLLTGQWGQVSGSITTYQHCYVGRSFWELAIAADIASGATPPRGLIRLSDADGISSYTGIAGNTAIAVWGGQWNPSARPEEGTPYIHTTTAVRAGISLVEIADRLKYHLLNGGTCSVYTNDVAGSSYTTCGLKPGTVPQLQLSDRRAMEFTLSLSLINLAATPVRMLAHYNEQ